MASEDEVRLGRIAVQRGLATQAQLIDALQARNRAGQGDLGAVLRARGIVTDAQLAELRRAVASGEGTLHADRTEASTDHAISIVGTREILARDQLEEALRASPANARAAYRELRRLAEEFADTESGVRAKREASELAKKHPDLERS